MNSMPSDKLIAEGAFLTCQLLNLSHGKSEALGAPVKVRIRVDQNPIYDLVFAVCPWARLEFNCHATLPALALTKPVGLELP